MSDALHLIEPRVAPPLDPGFRPAILANRHFRKEVEEAGGGVPLVMALERSEGAVSRYETRVFPDGHPRAAANLIFAERIFKFLLWQWGGWKAWIGGPRPIGDGIRKAYTPGGARAFDAQFMGEDVFARTFTVLSCDASEAPPAREKGLPQDGTWTGAGSASTSGPRIASLPRSSTAKPSTPRRWSGHRARTKTPSTTTRRS